jgi:hypothetical protein
LAGGDKGEGGAPPFRKGRPGGISPVLISKRLAKKAKEGYRSVLTQNRKNREPINPKTIFSKARLANHLKGNSQLNQITPSHSLTTK